RPSAVYITFDPVGYYYRHPIHLMYNHLSDKVHTRHMLMHIHHKHNKPAGHGSCLNHKLGSFLHGHEITGDFGMGNGTRTALADLATEQRHYRTRGSQHIAEPDHTEAGLAALAGQRLQYLLGKAFGSAHHIGGAYSLVRDRKSVV